MVQPTNVYPALLTRPPASVVVVTETETLRLQPDAHGDWRGKDGLAVHLATLPGGHIALRLTAPQAAVKRLHVRWQYPAADRVATPNLRILGDDWERGYGDLEWRGVVPERALLWYFAAHDVARQRTDCVGVLTGARAFCFFQADADGMSLWADVRSGGRGVALGEGRTLDVCTIVGRVGRERETPFAALHDFCRRMCPKPRLPRQPLYGHNDWYYAYGNNSAASILADARRIVALSPTGGNRPFAVIDAGWSPHGTDHGPWDRGNDKFPDMPGLAAQIRQAGARPGIWIRPLAAAPDAPTGWRLPRDHAYLDPTVPEALAAVQSDIARLHGWGYELIKHDFSTYDITGKWGFAMKPSITDDGWTFAEGNRRTTAEVILALYAAIREGAGDSLVLGCNTVSHLSAGLFESCRIGDDTSGRDWERTRRMGVNSLAFRACQHDTFYAADPDCVGVTNSIAWERNRQWLDLVARSGTALFVSLAPDAMTPEIEADLRAALTLAAAGPPLGEPVDWLETNCPAAWKLSGKVAHYRWLSEDGASPFGA